MPKNVQYRRFTKSLGSIFALALASAASLASPDAQAGIGLQSMTLKSHGRLHDGRTVIAVKFSFVENDDAPEPLLLDLGDGSEPIDLLVPAHDDPNDPWNLRLGDGVADTVIDADNSRYKSVFRSILHKFPESMDFTKIRIIGGAPVRFDILNHEGGKVQYENSFDLRNPVSGEVRYRAVDTDIVTLTPGKKHSFDLPRVRKEQAETYRCRLVSAAKSGLTSVPTIGEQKLRITEDCKIQWDTTGAKVGDRYMIQYTASDDDGREWVSLQTIQIVEDIDGVCDVTPGSAYMEAFANLASWSPPRIPVRIARVSGKGSRTIEAGGPVLVSFGERGSGRVEEPKWEESNAFYNILRKIPGTYLVTYSTVYYDELPELGPTVCPIVYEMGCKDTPEKDKDGDGVCDEVDNCPENGSSRDQWDSDGDGIGDLCDSDGDGDGLPNNADACPTSNAGQATDIRGCSVQDICPCPTDAWDWESKEQCTRRVSFGFMLRGIITRSERDALIEQAKNTACPERKPLSWSDLFWFL